MKFGKYVQNINYKTMKKLIIVPLIMGLIVSCAREDSDSVDQDKIYASYVLEYNTNNDITYARSNFHFSNALGTKLELVDPATITVDGETIPFKQGLAYYEKTFTGVKSSGDFVYTDVDGNVFSNTVTMVPTIDFSNLPDTLSRSSSFELQWIGDPVASDEVVTITINGSGEGDAKIFTQTGVGANSITLPATQLQDLGLENATFFIRRSKNVEAVEVTSAGGAVIARYDGASATVYIEQ